MVRLLKLFFLLPISLSAATGSWNGIAFTAWNGIAQTAWNGTTISCASGASWTPATPSNTLVSWLDASTQSFSDADPVGTLTAAAGPNATSSGTARPTFKTNIKNGHAIIRFDGSDDSMATSAFSVEQAQPLTMIVVFKFTSTTGVTIIVDGLEANKRCAPYNNSGTLSLYAGAAPESITATDTSWHILRVEFNSASSKYKLDGGTETTTVLNIGSHPLSGVTLGSQFAGSANWMNGDIAEVIVWSGILSGGDKTSADSYINTKWAVY